MTCWAGPVPDGVERTEWAPGSMMAGGGRFNGRGGRGGGGFMGGGRGGFGGGPMGRGGWGGTGNYQPRHVLFVHGLPPNMDETLLQQVINSYYFLRVLKVKASARPKWLPNFLGDLMAF